MKSNSKSRRRSTPLVLLILDGWGIAPKNRGNAIELARKPAFDRLWRQYPHTLLQASGRYAGLPSKQVGNSEAGHMNIGAGRIAAQDSVKISEAISDGTFFKNRALIDAVGHAKKNNSAIHLMGLLCDEQSAHADPDHLTALLTFLKIKKFTKIFLHLFTDGRDSSQYEAIHLLERLKSTFQNGEIVATVMGRFYAMDRNKKWERTEAAYNAMVLGEGVKVDNSNEAILMGYNRHETDEFIQPSVIYYRGRPGGTIKNNDAVIFFNLRSDRARQMAKPFVQDDFEARGGFKRKKIFKNLFFVTMTDFGPDLDDIATAFPSEDLVNTLPFVLDARYHQLYVAESEKYAHVTYFFNGGYANPVAGEDRIMIPSPKVKSYDQKPEMSVAKVTKTVVDSLKKKRHDFIVLNFANPDMVGHTGNLKAAIKAIEAVDKNLKLVADEIRRQGGTLIITADHGNADKMIDLRTNEIFTEHTRNPVPFILVSSEYKKKRLRKGGVLGDIAPTVLDILGEKKAKEMTEKTLLI